MEEDTESIPQIVNITKNNEPLLSLIKSVTNLMDNEKEHMVLTNLQLINILNTEFNINIQKKTELESEVYLNVLKHFLKTWPSWDELHDTLQNFSKKESENYLKIQCKNLKKYLLETLSTADNLLKPYIKKYNKFTTSSNSDEQTQEVVMKINCTRAQLNELIYRRPHPINGSIFNVIEGMPKKICTEPYNIQHIINYPNVQVTFLFPGFECYRTNSSLIERQIVNLKRSQNILTSDQSCPLNQQVYYRKSLYKVDDIEKSLVLSFLKKIEEVASTQTFNRAILVIFKLFLKHLIQDFQKGPDVFKSVEYRLNCHKYKYVRRSFVECKEGVKTVNIEGVNRDNFDLCLEEKLTPQLDFQITKLCYDTLNFAIKSPTSLYNILLSQLASGSWGRIECLECDKKFESKTNFHNLLQHFQDCHEQEPEWTCSGCQKSFNEKNLTASRWGHDC